MISLLSFALLVTAATCSPTPSLQSCAASMNGELPTATPSDFHFSGTVRRYYVAAEESIWDFAPTGWDNWLGVPLSVSPRAQAVIAPHGTNYLKALYRGYTDSTFTTRSQVPSWQGTQGHTIRSEVGDMVEIMFVNKLTTAYATMHSMGLAYNKMNEGSDYEAHPQPGKNSTLPVSSAVPPIHRPVAPGECVVYKWLTNDIAGPNNGPARAHSYHSYVDLNTDTNSGLIGLQIVYGRGQMNATMSNYREFGLLYMIYTENDSFLSAQNAERLNANHSADMSTTFGKLDTENLFAGNKSIWQPQVVNLNGTGQFSAASTFYTMNGYIFANNPTYEMCEEDQVIWYAYAYGADAHVFHMHGNSVTYNGEKAFAVGLSDGVSETLYMDAVDVGMWQVICHVSDHHQMGMVSNYLVRPKKECRDSSWNATATGVYHM